MKRKKRKEGITLISVVITVIILMILAGIFIGYITEKNGIIGKSKEASLKYKEEAEGENRILSNGIESYLEENEGEIIKVTGVKLDQNTARKSVEDTIELSATIEPSNATNQNLIWSSSNTNVAVVDTTGVVKIIGAGTATITVTTEDGNFFATCEITRILYGKRYKNYNSKWIN